MINIKKIKNIVRKKEPERNRIILSRWNMPGHDWWHTEYSKEGFKKIGPCTYQVQGPDYSSRETLLERNTMYANTTV
jgi:hypothetical protein